MTFEFWGHRFVPAFPWRTRWEVYLALAVYGAGLVVFLLRRRREFELLRGARLGVFFALLLVTPPLNNLFVLQPDAQGLLPPPFMPAEPAPPVLPLLGLLPVAVGAAWLGAGPAALLGLLAGVFRAGTTSHNILEPFSLALMAALAGCLLRQDYRGRLASAARQPLLALPAVVLPAWLVGFLSTTLSVYRPGGLLVALDYAWAIQKLSFVLAMLEAVAHGLLLQFVYLLDGRLRPVAVARRSPFYARTLRNRFLVALLPPFAVTMAALFFAVFQTAVSTANEQAVAALLRDTANGAEGISIQLSIGRSLLRQFATEPALWQGDRTLCTDRLRSDLHTLTYFTQLTAYGRDGEMLCTYPELQPADLTDEERGLLTATETTGALMITRVHRGSGEGGLVSFLSRLEDPQTEEWHGVLVGRLEVAMSPLMNEILGRLQGTLGEGQGFIVDSEGVVVAHPDPDRLLERWAVDQTAPALVGLEGGRGWVRPGYDSRSGARQLIGYLEVEGHPWAVVILLPYSVVLRQAVDVAGPLLGLLTVLTAAVGWVIMVVGRQLTRPLNALERAADRIAAGDLEHPVSVPGDDEVARLGGAFEAMRVGLKGRLDDLSLLLQVGQEVSATLDLARGMPPILSAALDATGAHVSRVVLLSASGDPHLVMGRGGTILGIGMLDRALALNAREADHALLIEDLSREPALAEFAPLPDRIQAAVALPVRVKGRAVAVMWVGYLSARRFESSKINLLSALVSQAAVLVENARLFQMAEGGRRRLAAVLSSTRESVLVTDRDDRLLLINPAAEQALGVTADAVLGREVEEVGLEEPVVQILTAPLKRTESLVKEVPLPGDRVFYASAAIIRGASDEDMGRVVVMRDITHFKEVDEMKSEFLATVSHDLRAPLTFVRGYATMLSMAGSLNEKQQEYLDKILSGTEQMGGLIGDLLNLGRIEAGVGLERKPCNLGARVVEAVDGMRARAAAKGLVLRVEVGELAPVILGDATLLRQAVANLVDNAIKYTPAEGTVTVGLRVSPEEIFIAVSDTGIGIAPEDQVRLFEKYFRIRRQDAGDVQGTGLGLAIVKSIVERHGGRVWAESALNQGSTFTIALPIRQLPSEESAEA